MLDLGHQVGVLAEGLQRLRTPVAVAPTLSVFAATTRGRFRSWASQTSPNAPAPRYLYTR